LLPPNALEGVREGNPLAETGISCMIVHSEILQWAATFFCGCSVFPSQF